MSNIFISSNSLSPMPGIDNRGDNEEIILTSMNLSELPKNRFAVHVLAVFNPINISVRQCIHVSAILNF